MTGIRHIRPQRRRKLPEYFWQAPQYFFEQRREAFGDLLHNTGPVWFLGKWGRQE
jgi:hypothetical protein